MVDARRVRHNYRTYPPYHCIRCSSDSCAPSRSWSAAQLLGWHGNVKISLNRRHSCWPLSGASFHESPVIYNCASDTLLAILSSTILSPPARVGYYSNPPRQTEIIANREQTELADDLRKVVNIFEEYFDLNQEVTDMLAYFLIDVGRPFGHYRDLPIPHRLTVRIPANIKTSVQSIPISVRIREERNRQTASKERHRTSTVPVGISDIVCLSKDGSPASTSINAEYKTWI